MFFSIKAFVSLASKYLIEKSGWKIRLECLPNLDMKEHRAAAQNIGDAAPLSSDQMLILVRWIQLDSQVCTDHEAAK